MSLEINVEQKKLTKYKENIKIRDRFDVYNLKEVQEIKSAVQEYMLFIGLDPSNYVKDIDIIGIGKSNRVYIDIKDIIRKAINTISTKVILVHNHPSNNLQPSLQDEEITIRIEKLLNAYDIKLADHIIVNDMECFSILKHIENMEELGNNIRDSILNDEMLIQENFELKRKIQMLENKFEENEDEFSM